MENLQNYLYFQHHKHFVTQTTPCQNRLLLVYANIGHKSFLYYQEISSPGHVIETKQSIHSYKICANI